MPAIVQVLYQFEYFTVIFELDAHKCMCIRANDIVSDHSATAHHKQVERFQLRCCQELREYLEQNYGDAAMDRYSKFLLRLPTLRSLEPIIMEELFFAGLIGNVQIDSIIPYILRMETAEYSSHMGTLDSSPSPTTSISEITYHEPAPAFVISPVTSANQQAADGVISVEEMERNHDIVSEES